MISEVSFAQSYSSTWRLVAPATDLFVRKLNTLLREREFPPLKSNVVPERRGFVNEVAFQLFSKQVRILQHPNFSKDDLIASASRVAKQTISRVERIPLVDIADPTDDEKADLTTQADRLRLFFSKAAENTDIQLSPIFPGCGIIDACVGDVLCGDMLYEVKAGDRNFRSIDIRQLLLYAALNKSAGVRPLNRVGLVNPRTGFSASMTLEELCAEVSGTSAGELLAELIRVISSGDTSR